jgi:hypothetical protein
MIWNGKAAKTIAYRAVGCSDMKGCQILKARKRLGTGLKEQDNARIRRKIVFVDCFAGARTREGVSLTWISLKGAGVRVPLLAS